MRDLIGGCRVAHFFSSHLEGMKRRLGSGAADRELISLSRVNQSISGSKGFTYTPARVRIDPLSWARGCLLPTCIYIGLSHRCPISHAAVANAPSCVFRVG